MTELIVKLVQKLGTSEHVVFNGEWEISTVYFGFIVAEEWFEPTTYEHRYVLRTR